MSGGLVQLVARGPQDTEIISDTGRNLFDDVFRSHEPYGMQIHNLDLTTSYGASFGQTAEVKIPRMGDLVGTIFVELEMKRGTGSTYYPGEAFLEKIELFIGSQLVDTHTSETLRIKNDLFLSGDDAENYRRNVDFTDSEITGTLKKLRVPMRFFFNDRKKPFPLIALTQQDLRIVFKFADTVKGIDGSYEPVVKIYGEFFYLNTERRKQVAADPHEILIEQTQIYQETIQISPVKTVTTKSQLFFAGPVKYLAMCCTRKLSHGIFTGGMESETDELLSPVLDISLALNNHALYDRMPADFMNRVTPTMTDGTRVPPAGVYFVPFGFEPGNALAPSGSLNFSRVDQILLSTTLKSAKSGAIRSLDLTDPTTTVAAAAGLNRLLVIGVNWNVLRIQNGVSGVKYAN